MEYVDYGLRTAAPVFRYDRFECHRSAQATLGSDLDNCAAKKVRNAAEDALLHVLRFGLIRINDGANPVTYGDVSLIAERKGAGSMHKVNTYPVAAFMSPGWPWPDSPNVLFSFERFQTEALKTMLRCQIEMLRFVTSRSEQDLRFLADLWSPEHVSDAPDLYCCFWQNAFLDYSEEAGRIADIGSSFAAKTAKHVHEEGKLLTEDLAAQTVV